MKRDFGYTDPRDIEWAERTSSKSGLPYGTSPSQKEAFAKAQWERDKPFLIGCLAIVAFIGLGFCFVILSVP